MYSRGKLPRHKSQRQHIYLYLPLRLTYLAPQPLPTPEAQLGEATREFDKRPANDEFRSLSRTERARWRRALRGRPKIGKGSKPVQITIERGLLEKADRLARRMGLSRSELIGSGLRVLLAAAARGRELA